MMLNRQAKERIIESYLSKYNTYKVGMKNCQKQLDYLMPSLTAKYESDGCTSTYSISNNTEKFALDRITSKKALDLLEEIEHNKLIIECIENAIAELDEREKQFVELRYFKGLKVFELKPLMHISEEKTFYRIRRQSLDKLLISLNNLICLK